MTLPTLSAKTCERRFWSLSSRSICLRPMASMSSSSLNHISTMFSNLLDFRQTSMADSTWRLMSCAIFCSSSSDVDDDDEKAAGNDDDLASDYVSGGEGYCRSTNMSLSS